MNETRLRRPIRTTRWHWLTALTRCRSDRHAVRNQQSVYLYTMPPPHNMFRWTQ